MKRHKNLFWLYKQFDNPTLKAPALDKEFYLITDGSKTTLSVILAEKNGEDNVPIEFYGRKLKESEKKYPVYSMNC